MTKYSLKKLITCSILLAFTLTGITACKTFDTKARRENSIQHGDTITLYAGCDQSSDTVTALFMKDFANRIQEKSKGKIKVEAYSDGQAGGDSELLEAVRSGNMTFAFQNTSPQVPLIKEAAILDAPMAFKNKNIARQVLDGKLLEALKPYYREKNLELLAFADQGFREMTSNKKIDSYEDIKGIKIRTMENSNHIAFWRSLGANPTPMAYAEVYIGLQQGVIDSQENALESIIGPRLYEQQKYMYLTQHIIHSVSIIASKDIMDSLTEEQRNIIYEASQESKIWARTKTDELLEIRKQTMRDSGMQIKDISDEMYNKMYNAAQPVWEKIENNIGKDLVEILRQSIKEAE